MGSRPRRYVASLISTSTISTSPARVVARNMQDGVFERWHARIGQVADALEEPALAELGKQAQIDAAAHAPGER